MADNQQLLEHALRNFLREAGVSPATAVLLALSGGRDSVVLGSLLHAVGQNFAVAHVNYGLRVFESDADAALARACAEKWGAVYHELKPEALKLQQNLQEKAREIRYKWFDELCHTHQYAYVLTAHHLSDQAETMLQALLRGRGMKAAQGMLPVQGNRLRPLLQSSQEALAAYAQAKTLQWATDSSNASLKYDRNYLRHEISPRLQTRFPHWETLLSRQGELWQQYQQLLDYQLDFYRPQVIHQTEANTQLWEFQAIAHLPFMPLLLAGWATELGFGQHLIEALQQLVNAQAGKQLQGAGFRVLRTATGFRWLADGTETPTIVNIDGPGVYTWGTSWLEVQYLTTLDASACCFDAAIVAPPFVLRSWQAADRFAPEGMAGTKKISDYYNDLKYDAWQKQQQPLLCAGADILWIVGRRRSRLAQPQPQTQEVWAFKWTINE